MKIIFLASVLAILGVTSAQAQSHAEVVARQSNLSAFGFPCGPELKAQPKSDALFRLQLNAPCMPDAEVTWRHENLEFTTFLSMTGYAEVILPVMARQAEVQVALNDVQLEASAEFPELKDFTRVALNWDGEDPGSLMAHAPKVLQGQIYHLGQAETGKVLHIFSKRTRNLDRSGVVRLAVETPVTEQTCAQGHRATILRHQPGRDSLLQELHLKGAGCDAVGEVVTFSNVVEDIRLIKD